MAKRIQLSRAAGFKKPIGVLSVSRPTIWGNPWVGPDAVAAYQKFMEDVRSGVLAVSTIESVMNVTRKFEKPLDEWKTLRGLMFDYVQKPCDVACWCPLNQPCHGNVIAGLPHLFAWYRCGMGTSSALPIERTEPTQCPAT